MEWKVGQKVWYVPSGMRHARQAYVREVTAIGLTWGELDGGASRFNLATGRIDGGDYSSPGAVYADRATYEAERLRQRAWADMREALAYSSVPDGVTIDDIAAARALLRR